MWLLFVELCETLDRELHSTLKEPRFNKRRGISFFIGHRLGGLSQKSFLLRS